MRLFACLIVAPQRGYDEPAILSYAISSFCPTSADGLQSFYGREDVRSLGLRHFAHYHATCAFCRRSSDFPGIPITARRPRGMSANIDVPLKNLDLPPGYAKRIAMTGSADAPRRPKSLFTQQKAAR